MKKLFLFLRRKPLLSPWEERGLPLPENCYLEGLDLSEIASWKAPSPEHSVAALLLDLDSILAGPRDEWSLEAWRATFQELITRSLGSQSPALWGYTRAPGWDCAQAAVKIGCRKLLRLEEVASEVSAHLEGRPVVEESPEKQAQILPWRPRENPPLAAEEDAPALPRHAIPFPIEGLDGSSAALEGLRALVRRSAPLDTPVLITGPTGAGKERVARALHRHSLRARAPFVTLSCGALTETLIDSELFGHVRGAFTDAHENRPGILASAEGGTVFLDEITDLSPAAQAKVLRVIEEASFFPVGSSAAHPLNVRWISSTAADLEEKIQAGTFRQDLYFRLKVMEIAVPSLSERKSDIPELCQTLLRRLARRQKQNVLELTDAALEKFLLYPWPGNVRELENALERSATLAWAENRKQIELKDLPDHLRFALMTSPDESKHLKEVVRRFEREYIQSTIRRLGGSKEEAAELLGLSLATLYRKIG